MLGDEEELPILTSHPRWIRELQQLASSDITQADELARSAIDEAVCSYLPGIGEEPARLHQAMWQAVAGGKRQRAQLCMVVGTVLGVSPLALMPLCTAIEFVHAASLVHDDLPCFDDADTRRGEPSCHVQFGVPTAILVGDALLARAFGVLASSTHQPIVLVQLLAEAVGSVRGVIGGQAMELEPEQDLVRYHSAKTAALYRLATQGAAIVAGDNRAHWAELGECIGALAQLKDDLIDVSGDASAAGKPVGRDELLARPNAAHLLGLDGTKTRAAELIQHVTWLGGELGSAGQSVVSWFHSKVALK